MKLLLVAWAFVLIPLLAIAQKEETGALAGSVKDEDGKPIPGVAILASNSYLVGWNSSTYTGAEGSYRFPVLPPGEYEIKAELQGFGAIVRKDVRLFAGETAIADFVLQPRALSEVLEIQEGTPAFDVTSPSMSKTIPGEEIEHLPRFLSSDNLFTITPGIGEDHVAYGSTPFGNVHTFDGVDITNQLSGLPVVIPHYNWIEEVRVIGLGAPAEYGGFTGVAINSVSRSGSNHFHGLVETFFQNQNFVSSNAPDMTPEIPFHTWDLSAQIGGPLIRDKLWFFTGLAYPYSQTRPFGYDGVVTQKYPKFITKLTYKANQNNTLQGFLERENLNIKGAFANAFTLPEAAAFDERPLWFWNLSWISFLKSETFLDIRTRGVAGPRKITGRNADLPGHLDVVTGIRSQNYFRTEISDRFRSQANAALSHYASNFLLGSHDFKFGVQYERSHVDADFHYNGNIFYQDYNGSPNIRLIDEVRPLEAISNTISSFAQDHWQIADQLNLSIGVRWDHNLVKLLSDPAEYVTDSVAPRLGFAYALKKDRTTILKVHYGRYYENVQSAFAFVLGNNATVMVEEFNHQTRNWELERIIPGTSSYRIDGDLKQPYTRQFTAGIDHVLPAGVNLSVHYIYKRDHDLIEDVNTTSRFEAVPYLNPITGQTITVFKLVDPGERTSFITNPQDLFRRYHAVEIYGSKRISDGFYLAGSIVFSTIKGNVDNDRQEGSGLSRVLASPNDQINSEGRLENDVTTEIKLHGYCSLPWSINTSWYFRHFSGETWTPILLVTGLNQGPVVAIFGLPRGSKRLPDRNTVDIRLEKMFPIAKSDLRFTLDVFNIFNTGYPLEVNANFGSPTFAKPTQFSLPRELRMGVRYTF